MVKISNQKKFIQYIEELFELYDEVKLVTILAENFDNNDEIYVAIINELRNSFDHVMRSIKNEQNLEKEFRDAKDHLFRAGYDAFEILSINTGNKIINSLNNFNKDAIATVFPEYYQKIRPELAQIKIELGEYRAKRRNPNINTTAFKEYSVRIKKLINSSKEVEFHIPEIIKYQKQQKKKYWLNRGIIFILGIISTLIIMFLSSKASIKMDNNKAKTPLPPKTHIEAQE